MILYCNISRNVWFSRI